MVYTNKDFKGTMNRASSVPLFQLNMSAQPRKYGSPQNSCPRDHSGGPTAHLNSRTIIYFLKLKSNLSS